MGTFNVLVNYIFRPTTPSHNMLTLYRR